MPNSRRLSELLKQVDGDTIWQKVVWNEAYEASIIMDNTEAESGQSFKVLRSEEERATIKIRTVDMENREEWICVQNDYHSKHSSNISPPNDSRMCRHTCAANKDMDEARERSNEGMHKRMKRQTNDLTVTRHDMLTNSPLELRFNSLREDYLCYLRSLGSVREEVDYPRSPGLAQVSDCERESNHEKIHNYGQTIDFKTGKAGMGNPLKATTTTDVRTLRCQSAEEVKSNHCAPVLRIVNNNQSLKEPPKVPTTTAVRTRRCPSAKGESNDRALLLRIENENRSLEEPPEVSTTTDVGARRRQSAAEEESNHRALVLTIENENQSLKELLNNVMLRNQLQATAIRNMNRRLDELETKLETHRSRKKLGNGYAHDSRVSSRSTAQREQANTSSTSLCRYLTSSP